MKYLLLITFTLLSLTHQSLGRLKKYTFTGVVSGFYSYSETASIDDFNLIIGESPVIYEFAVDFDRNAHSTSNSAAIWDHFYSDLLSDEILDFGFSEENLSHNGYFFTFINQSQLQGGSRVRVGANDRDDELWEIQDWVVGQSFNLTDEGKYQGSTTRIFCDVTLTSIEKIQEPTSIHGTPLTWLDEFNLNTDTTDPDGDGLLTWQEYIAGTKPNDDQSCLKIQMNDSVLSWKKAINRVYTIESTTNLTNGFIQVTNGLSTSSYYVPITNDAQYYRINVNYPE